MPVLTETLPAALVPTVVAARASIEVTPESAWAETSGRKIYLHPDLLDESPTVVWATVSHELAHILLDHARRRRTQWMWGLLSSLVAALAVTAWLGLAWGLAATAVLACADDVVRASLCRRQEFQADALAAKILERCGESNGSAAMAHALQVGTRRRLVLPQKPRSVPGESQPRFLARRARYLLARVSTSHPSLPRRLRRLGAAP